MTFWLLLAPPGRFELPTFRLGGERCYPAELRRLMHNIRFFCNPKRENDLPLRRRPLYTTELPGHFMGCGLQRVLFYPFLSRLSTPEREKAARRTKEKTEGVRMSPDALGFSEN